MPITCELCGGTDFQKIDGAFVCQSCGTKYSLEEARQLMSDAPPVQNQAQSAPRPSAADELQNLYALARRAKGDNNSEHAQRYYEQILLKDPESWEANFYTVYFQSMNCKIGEIQSAANRLTNCEDTCLHLVKRQISDPFAQKAAADEMGARIITLAEALFTAAMRHYNGIGDSIRNQYTGEMIQRCAASRDACYRYGDYVQSILGDTVAQSVSVPCWKMGITLHNRLVGYLADKNANQNIINIYAAKIGQFDKSYQQSSLRPQIAAAQKNVLEIGRCKLNVGSCVLLVVGFLLMYLFLSFISGEHVKVDGLSIIMILLGVGFAALGVWMAIHAGSASEKNRGSQEAAFEQLKRDYRR